MSDAEGTPWIVGIDLGTTHCAMARIAADGSAAPEIIPLPQLLGPSELQALPLLPSFLYLPPQAERPLALPWDGEREFAVGAYARRRAAEVPGRVVSSAKSWLCHVGADRRAGVLPTNAAADLERISPVEASWRYLEHLAEAYDAAYADDGGPLCEQQVVLTVPASFDAAARELTVEAALAAGIDNLTLLEEPQAALYAWLDHHGEAWRDQLKPGDRVLVVDIGGGTSDFSAIDVHAEDGQLSLLRIAVGDHILLGGDNMDLALAYQLRQQLEDEDVELDDWQFSALVQLARAAKEKLLHTDAAAEQPIAIPSRGAKLVGGTVRTKLERDAMRALLENGFFPTVAADAKPAKAARAGLRQVGLSYAADPAVTKHLARFVTRLAATPAADVNGTAVADARLPTCVLFNGGVMRSAHLRARLLTILNGWLKDAGAPPLRVLDGGDLELAVARGAACYGRARRGAGIRIRGGSARAYYVGIESAMPAIPGMTPPVTLLCVAPFGMEAGQVQALPDHQLAVVVGEAVQFRFFGSSQRRQDAAGDTLERYRKDEVAELSPIAVTLKAGVREDGELVPVRLRAELTEVGTLLLEALPVTPKQADERWKIELSVRSSQ